MFVASSNIYVGGSAIYLLFQGFPKEGTEFLSLQTIMPTGFEPVTCPYQEGRSSNWAMAAIAWYSYHDLLWTSIEQRTYEVFQVL